MPDVLPASLRPTTRCAACLLALLGTSSCVATVSTFAVPETLAPGEQSMTAGMEAQMLAYQAPPPPGALFSHYRNTARELPLLPNVADFRVGLGDGVDAGVGVLRTDVKVALLRADVVSVAVAPGLRGGFAAGRGTLLADAPVLVGFKPAEAVRLVASPGLAWMTVGELDSDRSLTRVALLRGGGGVRVQTGRVAFHAEVTGMRSFREETMLIAGGLAVVVRLP